jgi:hypothetical protein
MQGLYNMFKKINFLLLPFLLLFFNLTLYNIQSSESTENLKKKLDQFVNPKISSADLEKTEFITINEFIKILLELYPTKCNSFCEKIKETKTITELCALINDHFSISFNHELLYNAISTHLALEKLMLIIDGINEFKLELNLNNTSIPLKIYTETPLEVLLCKIFIGILKLESVLLPLVKKNAWNYLFKISNICQRLKPKELDLSKKYEISASSLLSFLSDLKKTLTAIIKTKENESTFKAVMRFPGMVKNINAYSSQNPYNQSKLTEEDKKALEEAHRLYHEKNNSK